MNRLRSPSQSDARILVGALAVLSVIAVIAVLTAPPPPMPPLSVRSTEADGAMVLRLWLEQTGYAVREVLSDPIQPDPSTVLFILEPQTPYSREEADSIQRWVKRGNTLIVFGNPYLVRQLLDPYNVSMGYLPDRVETLTPSSSSLQSPPVGKFRADAIYGIDVERSGATIHISADDIPVLVSFKEGQGTVWVSGMLGPFSNRGLRDPGSARVLLNLLAGAPSGAKVAFDEARHGFTESPRTIFGLLVATAPGWGIILAIVLTMVYLGMRGRRFGRPVPIPDERLRREPVEYIQAMANLFRRSGQRSDILNHYRYRLRRRLSERYAVDPRLPDIDLIKAIVFRDPSVDESDLRRTLIRLSRPRASEQDLIAAALDVDQWLNRLR